MSKQLPDEFQCCHYDIFVNLPFNMAKLSDIDVLAGDVLTPGICDVVLSTLGSSDFLTE